MKTPASFNNLKYFSHQTCQWLVVLDDQFAELQRKPHNQTGKTRARPGSAAGAPTRPPGTRCTTARAVRCPKKPSFFPASLIFFADIPTRMFLPRDTILSNLRQKWLVFPNESSRWSWISLKHYKITQRSVNFEFERCKNWNRMSKEASRKSTTKMCESVEPISRHSQKQMINYLKRSR